MGRKIIGTFYNNKKDAVKFARKQNEIYRKEFLILEVKNGFCVVSERQLE